MCRMIAFVGDGSADLQSLYRAFRAGSRCDPYLRPALGTKLACHPHGWGLGLYDGDSLHHFRSSLPVWQEEVPLPPIQGKKRVQAVFHSRYASDVTLNTAICSHPFIASTDKEILLLAHNGGVEMDDPAAARIVDSEWALSVMVKARGIEKALPFLKERTKENSALNLIVLAIPRAENAPPAIHCLNYFKTQEPGRVAYYTMYTADFGGGKVFMSSTFKDLKIKGLTKIEVAPFGELFNL
jgi:predicted glutamine amidotransferase